MIDLNGPDLNTEIDSQDLHWAHDRHYCTIAALTGLAVDPFDYPRSVLGLDGYLQTLLERQVPPGQKTNFHALEFVRCKIHHMVPTLFPEAFDDPMHGPVLLPARWAWPRIGLLSIVVQRCRLAAQEPITILYLWRPKPINDCANPKTPGSDHVSATALDMHFPSAKSWSRIRTLVLEPIWQSNLLHMSFGWNSRVSHKFHVGFFAPATLLKGAQRRWDYYEPPKKD